MFASEIDQVLRKDETPLREKELLIGPRPFTPLRVAKDLVEGSALAKEDHLLKAELHLPVVGRRHTPKTGVGAVAVGRDDGYDGPFVDAVHVVDLCHLVAVLPDAQ